MKFFPTLGGPGALPSSLAFRLLRRLETALLQAAAGSLCRAFAWLWGAFCLAFLALAAPGLAGWAGHKIAEPFTGASFASYFSPEARLSAADHAQLHALVGPDPALAELAYPGNGPAVFYTPYSMKAARLKLSMALALLDEKIECLERASAAGSFDSESCEPAASRYASRDPDFSKALPDPAIRRAALDGALAGLRSQRALAARALDRTRPELSKTIEAAPKDFESAAVDPRCVKWIAGKGLPDCPLRSLAAKSLGSAGALAAVSETVIFLAAPALLIFLGVALHRQIEPLERAAGRKLSFYRSAQGAAALEAKEIAAAAHSPARGQGPAGRPHNRI